MNGAKERKSCIDESKNDLDSIKELIEDMKDQNQRAGMVLRDKEKILNQSSLAATETES